MITLDSHCDTPMFFDQGINFATRDKKILVDLHKITEGHLDATIMVAYLKQLERTDEALSAATAKTDRILNEIEEMVAKNCTAVDIAYTPADLCRLKKQGKRLSCWALKRICHWQGYHECRTFPPSWRGVHDTLPQRK